MGFAFGSLASFGVLVVATFQETNVIIVHLLGAVAAFGVGGVYMWCHAYLSYRVHHVPGWLRPMCHVRLCLAVLASCSFVLTMSLGSEASSQLPGNHTGILPNADSVK